MSWVGSRVTRVEDAALLTGEGRFVDDIHMPGMLQAAVVRSPYAHARITGIDASAALDLPGVHAVLTHADLPEKLREPLPLLVPNPAIRYPVTQHALAKDAVHFVGEAIALVLADDRYIAEDAAELVFVDFEPLPAASDFRKAAAAGAPIAHAGRTDNVAAEFKVGYGDVAQAFAKAAHVFREELSQHRGAAHPMECRAMVAMVDPVSDGMRPACPELYK